MKKAVIVGVLVAALIGLGYVAMLPEKHWLFGSYGFPKIEETSGPGTVKSIIEQTPQYIVNINYRLSGNQTVDSRIESAMQDAVEIFKEIAADFDPTVSTRPYTLDGEAQNVYIGSDVVSTRINLYQDTGGAHGIPLVFALNYDVRTSAVIPLGEVLTLIDKSLTEVADRAEDELVARFGDSVFLDGVAPKEENYQTFSIDASNVTFIFTPYQAVSYASGMPEVSFARINQ
jgi:hypothetical protein